MWHPHGVIRGSEYGTLLGIGIDWKVLCFSPFSRGSHGVSEALQNAVLLPCSSIPGDSPKYCEAELYSCLKKQKVYTTTQIFQLVVKWVWQDMSCSNSVPPSNNRDWHHEFQFSLSLPDSTFSCMFYPTNGLVAFVM